MAEDKIDFRTLLTPMDEEKTFDEPEEGAKVNFRSLLLDNKEPEEIVPPTVSKEAAPFTNLVDNGEPKKNPPSLWRQIRYGIDRSVADYEYATDLQRIYSDNPWNAAKYGSDFDSLTSDERRRRIEEVDNAELAAKYQDVLDSGYENSAAVWVGDFIKQLASPLTVIPLGKMAYLGWKGAAAVGGAFAAEYNMLKQMAQEGTIDESELLLHTAAGVGGGVAFYGAWKAAKFGWEKLVTPQNTPALSRVDSDPQGLYREMYKEGIKKLAAGGSQADASQAMFESVHLPLKDLLRLEKNLGHKITAPTRREAEVFYEISDRGSVRAKEWSETGPMEWLRNSFVPVYDRVAEINKRLYGKLTKHEYDVHKELKLREDMSQELSTMTKKLMPEKDHSDFWYNITHNKWDEAENIIHRSVPTRVNKLNLLTVLDDVKGELKKMGDDAVALRMFKKEELIDGYFPHKIKYIDELMEVMQHGLGKEGPSTIKALQDAMKGMSEYERAQFMNSWMRGFKQKIPNAKPTFVRERRFKNGPPSKYEIDPTYVTPEFRKKHNITYENGKYYADLRQYYFHPQEALHMYMRQMTDEMGVRKLFGVNHIKTKKAGGTDIVDMKDTIGAFVDQELSGMTHYEIETIKKLLEARFLHGRAPSTMALRTSKDIVYAGMLGNFPAGITQTGDLGAAAYMSNILSMSRTMTRRLIGYPGSVISRARGQGSRGLIDSENLGFRQASFDMDEVVALGTNFNRKKTEKAAKFMSGVTNWSLRAGFRQIDKLGKNVLAESTFHKAARQLRTEKGYDAFIKEQAKIFGLTDATNMANSIRKVNDILKKEGTAAAASKMDDYAKMYMFNKITEIQPVTLGGAAYHQLTSPGAKYLYMLGSFVIRHIGVGRRDIYNKIKSGHVVEGSKNLALYAAYLGTFNLGAWQMKHYLKYGELDESAMLWGKEFDWGKTVLTLGIQMAKMFGLSEYVADQWQSGKTSSQLATEMLFSPAVTAIPEAVERAITTSGKDNTNWSRLANFLPFAGSMTSSKLLHEEVLNGVPWIGDVQGFLANESYYKYKERKVKRRDEIQRKELGIDEYKKMGDDVSREARINAHRRMLDAMSQ